MYGMHRAKQESYIILFTVHAAFLMDDDEENQNTACKASQLCPACHLDQ